VLATPIGGSQEDATCHDVIIVDTDDEQDARHPPLAADDRHESPDNVCPPLLGHVDSSCDAINAESSDEPADEVISPLPSAHPEVDHTGSRHCHERHHIGDQSHVVIHPTWLPTFQSEYSDTYEDQCASRSGCFRATGSLAIVRRRQDRADVVRETGSIIFLQAPSDRRQPTKKIGSMKKEAFVPT